MGDHDRLIVCVGVYVCAGANVNAQTFTKGTALTYACENGHTEVAEVLIHHGAELVSDVFRLHIIYIHTQLSFRHKSAPLRNRIRQTRLEWLGMGYK